MDQLKVFLKQAVKYRFWIALGLSALLPMIGYLVGSGPINEKSKAETAAITSAEKDVQNYTSPGIPNDQYKPIVDEKKEVLTRDVEKAWDKLYTVQAPLLKWPDRVEERFHKWGRKWPEDIDKGAVQQAITDYVLEYDKSVAATYKKANPWDPETGEGVVVIRPQAAILRPSVFDVAKPPTLGKVWAAQERLWIQGTLLDAIAKINSPAKSWDGAIVKEVLAMEVGSPAAQDQKSMAKGETVEPAPSLDPEGTETAAAPAAEAGGPGAAYAGMMGAMGGSGGGQPGATEEVYYLKTDSLAYKVLPVELTVLVDQNRLQDFFIGLENSPMSIQVMEFEIQKPLAPVEKPVKGETSMGGFGGMAGMYSGMGSGMGRGLGRGMGDMTEGNPGMGMMRGMPGMSGGYPGMSGGMMGGMGKAQAKSGIDNRSKDAKKDRAEKEKKRREMSRSVDMYYDIVQVTVYGQARFYNPPPPPPSTESNSTTPGDPATPPVADPGKPAVADPGKPTDPGKPADATTPAVADPGKPTDPAKPADATPPAAKPADSTPPADATSPAAKAADAKPADAKPADASPPAAKPADATSPAAKPADATPPATKPADAPK